MADYFYDPQSPTNGNGLTKETPKNTWTGMTAIAGNRYLQKYGSTSTVPLAPYGTGGTVDSRITFGVYEPMTGAFMNDVKGGAFIDATGQTQGVYIGLGRPYITLTGFEVYGSTSYAVYKDSTSLASDEDQFFYMENCILRNSSGVGADLRGKGNKVLNCDIYDNASDGLFIRGHDLEVGWSTLRNNGLVGAVGDGIQLVDSSNFHIHNSSIEHEVASKQSFICTEEYLTGISGGLIEDTKMACLQYISGVTLPEQKTVLILTPGVTIRRCIVEGGQYGAFMQGVDGVLEDSLLVLTGNGDVAAIAIRASGVDVLRNTVIGRDDRNNSYGIDHNSSTYTGVTIHNNVLKGWSKAIRTTTSGYTYSHNAFENCDVRNSNTVGTEGTAGTGDKTGDLGLSDNYRPVAGSQLIGAGLGQGITTDIDGLQRPNPPSIGAYEPFQYSGVAFSALPRVG